MGCYISERIKLIDIYFVKTLITKYRSEKYITFIKENLILSYKYAHICKCKPLVIDLYLYDQVIINSCIGLFVFFVCLLFLIKWAPNSVEKRWKWKQWD